MIHIGKEWYIGGDVFNIILYERKIIKTGPNKGNEYYDETAYYTTFSGLLDGLTKREIRLSISEAKELNDVKRDIQAVHETIKELFARYEKELKKIVKEDRKK
jgi:RNA processing factor Prp31